jgi:phosphatidylethanolamine/phosphatidyl-N-methylethanolamine N-methyltransferase
MPSNAWTRFRYSLWAPHYDRVTKFPRERRRAVTLLQPRRGERLLVIGCGTGADLPFLPEGVEVLAVDLTPAMIRQAMAHARPGIEFRVMDGMALDLPGGSFDAAILHMVLEVVPDPARCLAEAARVLRVGGRLSIFDKFVPAGVRHGPLRRAGLALIDFVFTTTNQRMEEILIRSGAPLAVERDEPSVASYRHLILRRI